MNGGLSAGRGRLRRTAGWLPALVLVPAAALAGVAVTLPDDDLGAIREQQPIDLGTTWVYDVADHGEPSGSRTSQVVGRASVFVLDTGLVPTVETRRSYTDYPGSGPRTFTSYLALKGDTLLQYAQEEAGTWFDLTPAAPAYRVPGEVGATLDYDGTVGPVGYRYETELVEVGDTEAGGRRFTDCARFEQTTTSTVEGEEPVEETYEEWTCPDVGTVRSRLVNETDDVDITEELVAFHGVAASWSAGDVALTDGEDTGTVGFGPARTFGVDGTLGREPAWTDSRPERALHPPVGADGLVVTAEPDGSVSATTTGTGELRWRVQLDAPVVVPPVLADGVVVVADPSKRVWALSAETGQALWTSERPDVAAASPVVVGDTVVVASDDGTLAALDLADGATVWEQSLGGPARTAPAYDGEHLLVGDTSGTLSALDPATGEADWTASLATGLTQGPLVVDDLALVQDGDGVVHAFAAADGAVAWQSRGRGTPSAPMVAGGGVVVASTNTDRLAAFDTRDGARLWSRGLPATPSPPAVVGEELLSVSRGGEVRVLGLRDGRVRDVWSLPQMADDTSFFVDVAPALVDGTVVVSAWTSSELAHAATYAYPVTEERAAATAGGSLTLTGRELPGSLTEAPLTVGEDVVAPTIDTLYRIAPDGSATTLATSSETFQTGAVVSGDVVVTRTDTGLQAVSLADGTPLWQAESGSKSFGALRAADDRTVVAGDVDTGLLAFDLRTGQPRWRAPIPVQYAAVTPLVLPDGDVVYGGGGLARYDGRTGEQEWVDVDAQLFGPAAYAGGVVYAAGLSPEGPAALAAHDAATGERLWEQPITDPPVHLGPAVGDGVVVAYDGAVAHAHDAATGEELWSLAMHRPPLGSPVVADGRVYLVESGVSQDLDDQQYRVSVHDLRTGRLLASWQPPSTPTVSTNNVVAAGPDGSLVVPTTFDLVTVALR